MIKINYLIINNIMEYSNDEPSTPCFGNSEDKNKKSSPNISLYIKAKEKYKKKEKRKSKSKKNKKISEKSKSKHKSSKSKKKKIPGKSNTVEQRYENPLENFLKKKLELRNDFDQDNSEKFLAEKELAFQQFQMDANFELLDNEN